MNEQRITILVDAYTKGGGACKSLRDCVNILTLHGNDVQVLCSRTSCKELPDNVHVVRNNACFRKLLVVFDTRIVLFFKAAKSLIDKSIFSRYVEVKNNFENEIKAITIVCQQPSNPCTILTPFEIKHSDHMIFIDKTAYNDSLYSFIPKERKSWMYLTTTDDGPNPLDKYQKKDYAMKNGEVVYGRGSSFNKCPKDVLEPFDKLNLPFNKKFIIVGVPQNNNWLTKKIMKRGNNDVVTYPMVGFEEWIKLICSFDIGLYYLPKDAHSSIDGTLGQMMRIGLPVIVGGASAPKERITHGENGYIADTVPEMVKYAELLANNQKLREKIGRKARQTTIELNSKSWLETLETIMSNVKGNKNKKCFQIPFDKTIKIYFIHYMSLLKAWFIRPINKVLS